MNTPVSRIGRYEVLRELGRGTMGVVYEARDPLLGRHVALKTIQFMPTDTATERARFEERFLGEARAAARLSHRGIVHVHDLGRDEHTGTLFIAFERLDGLTLAEVAEQGGFQWRRALLLAADLAHALDHAHTRGIVHRDVKPENIMVLASGQPKLMDFGIAKTSTADLTAPGQVFGTPRYMAPEQVMGAPVDARCDVFSLGCVLYWLLTGRHAFGAPNVAQVLRQLLHEHPPTPSRLNPDVPAAVDIVVMRALAKSPDQRYQTAAVLAADLDAVLGGNELPSTSALHPDDLLDELQAELIVECEAPVDPLAGLLDVADASARRAAPPPPRPQLQQRWLIAGVLALAAAGVGAWPAARSPASAEALGMDLPAGSGLRSPIATARPAMPPRPVTVAPRPTVQPARLSVDLQHNLKAARLRIWGDGALLLDEPLRGTEKRRLALLRTTKGTLSRRLEIQPATQMLRVEVSWSGGSRQAFVPVRLSSGASRRLRAEVQGRRRELSVRLS